MSHEVGEANRRALERMASIEAVRQQLTQENASLRRSIEDMLALLRSTSEAVEHASGGRLEAPSRRSSLSFTAAPAPQEAGPRTAYHAPPTQYDAGWHTGDHRPATRAHGAPAAPAHSHYMHAAVRLGAPPPQEAYYQEYDHTEPPRRRDTELLVQQSWGVAPSAGRRRSVSQQPPPPPPQHAAAYGYDEEQEEEAPVYADEDTGYDSMDPPPVPRRGRQERSVGHDAPGRHAAAPQPRHLTRSQEQQPRHRDTARGAHDDVPGHSGLRGVSKSREPEARAPFAVGKGPSRAASKAASAATATELALTLGRTKARVGALLTRCALLDAKRTQAEEELATLRASADAAAAASSSELTALKALVARLTTDLEAATTRADKAEALVVSQSAAVERLEERLTTLTYERDLARDQARLLEAQKDGAQATAEGLSRTVNALVSGTTTTASTAAAAAAAAAAAVATAGASSTRHSQHGSPSRPRRAGATRRHSASPPRSLSSHDSSREEASEAPASALPDVRAMVAAARRRASIPQAAGTAAATGGTSTTAGDTQSVVSSISTARMSIEVPRRAGEGPPSLPSPPRPSTRVVQLGAPQWTPERGSSPEGRPASPPQARLAAASPSRAAATAAAPSATARPAPPPPPPAPATLFSATAPPVVTRHHATGQPLASPTRDAVMRATTTTVFSPAASAPLAYGAQPTGSPPVAATVPWVETLRSEVANLRAENLRLRAGISGTEASLAIAQRHVVALERDLAGRAAGASSHPGAATVAAAMVPPAAAHALQAPHTQAATLPSAFHAPASAAALSLGMPAAAASMSPALLSSRSGSSRGLPTSPLAEFSGLPATSSSNPSVRDILVMMGAVGGPSSPRR